MQELSETKRFSRNLSEKRRRDMFNFIVTELAAIVCGDGRKLDKSNVLRQTIAFLQKHKEGSGERPSDPGPAPDGYLSDAGCRLDWLLFLQQALDVFLLVVSDSGRVMFASDNFPESYPKCSLEGKFVKDLLDQSSITAFQRAIEKCTTASKYDDLFTFSWSLRGDQQGQCSGQLRVKVCGQFAHKSQLSQSVQAGCSVCAFCAVCAPIFPLPNRRCPSVDACRQFSCVYSIEWNIIRVDENWIRVTGWHPFEILGCSGYDLCHPDDLQLIAAEHESLMCAKKMITKEHRLQTKSGTWLTVQGHCTIVENENHVLCVYRFNGLTKNADELEMGCIAGAVDDQLLSARRSPKHQLSLESKSTSFVSKPQPGVSIEHSPLPLTDSSVASPADTDAQSGGSIKLSADEERLLCETLIQRQASLQQQIAQYQTELCLLKSRLYLSIGTVGSAETSSQAYDVRTPSEFPGTVPTAEFSAAVGWNTEVATRFANSHNAR